MPKSTNKIFEVTDRGVFQYLESWIITIPKFDNDKKPFDKKTLEDINDKVASNKPGYSIVDGVVGYWKWANKIYFDDSYQIIVDCAPIGNRKNHEFFYDLKVECEKVLDQAEIYLIKIPKKIRVMNYDQFFDAIGFETLVEIEEKEKHYLALEIEKEIESVLLRKGYHTLDTTKINKIEKTIFWERKLDKISFTLKSEINCKEFFDEDGIPDDIEVLPVDRIDRQRQAAKKGKSFITFGEDEFLYFADNPNDYKPLVYADIDESLSYKLNVTPFMLKRYIEQCSEKVFICYLIMREEGLSIKDIEKEFFSIGAFLTVKKGNKKYRREISFSDTIINNPGLKIKDNIENCFNIICNLYESKKLDDDILLFQAKARNEYLYNRYKFLNEYYELFLKTERK